MVKTIVMVHGLFGHGGVWSNYRKYFEKRGYEVHTPSLRYHDERFRDHPPVELGAVGVRDYADDLAVLIQSLGVKPVVIGHSMGGLLALMLAERGLVERAALLGPTTPAGIDNVSIDGASVLMNVLRAPRLSSKPVKLSFRGAVKGGLGDLSPEERKDAYTAFRFDSGRALSEVVFWRKDPTGATRIDPARITCPVLIVAGGKDVMVPLRGARELAKELGRTATLREFPGHSHQVLAGPHWEEVAECVCEWFVSSSARRVSRRRTGKRSQRP